MRVTAVVEEIAEVYRAVSNPAPVLAVVPAVFSKVLVTCTIELAVMTSEIAGVSTVLPEATAVSALWTVTSSDMLTVYSFIT